MGEGTYATSCAPGFLYCLAFLFVVSGGEGRGGVRTALFAPGFPQVACFFLWKESSFGLFLTREV